MMALHGKKIKFFLGLGFLLCASMTSPSFAQDGSGRSLSEDSVVTSKFWDNWFVGAGAGAQLYFGEYDKLLEFGERLTPAYELYVGKWFSPNIGVRAAFGGSKVNGLTANGSHSTCEVYNSSRRLQKQEFKYFHAHADVLFNLNNILEGYKADRFYTLSPYVGLGAMRTRGPRKKHEVSASAGLFNAFRLGSAIDLTLDVRGTYVNQRFDGEVGGRKLEGPLTTTLGLTFKFKKRE